MALFSPLVSSVQIGMIHNVGGSRKRNVPCSAISGPLAISDGNYPRSGSVCLVGLSDHHGELAYRVVLFEASVASHTGVDFGANLAVEELLWNMEIMPFVCV